MTEDEAKPWLGLLAAALAVMIWAGWITATRAAMLGQADPLLIAFCRNVVPAVLLLPVTLRRGILPRGASLGAVALMTLGWGAPFAFATAQGVSTVPASLFSPLTPGPAPILVALISAGLLGERLRGEAVTGLVLIGLALALIIGQWLVAADAAALEGVPWLLVASLGLATYTVAFRRSGLSPLEGVGYVGLWSVPILALLALLRPSAFSGVSAGEYVFHLLTQGLLSGVVGVLAYGVALRHLGAVRGSMANAMMPVAAGIAGVLLLGERLGPLDWIAIALASLGVAAANGAFRWRRRKGVGLSGRTAEEVGRTAHPTAGPSRSGSSSGRS